MSQSTAVAGQPTGPSILIPGQIGVLTDHFGNVWSLAASGSAMMNNAFLASGHGILVLVLAGSPATVWALSANNGLWYQYVGTSGAPWLQQAPNVGPPGLAAWTQYSLDPDLNIWSGSLTSSQAALCIAIQTIRRSPFGVPTTI